MGDINLHLDVSTDASTSSFSSLLAANNLVQVVQSPKHTAGHLLDVVIIGSDTTVTFINVPPPVLSDQLHDRRHARSALRESPQLYTVGKKTAPFYFLNNFVKSRSILIIFGTDSWMNLQQNIDKNIHLPYLPCKT